MHQEPDTSATLCLSLMLDKSSAISEALGTPTVMQVALVICPREDLRTLLSPAFEKRLLIGLPGGLIMTVNLSITAIHLEKMGLIS